MIQRCQYYQIPGVEYCSLSDYPTGAYLIDMRRGIWYIVTTDSIVPISGATMTPNKPTPEQIRKNAIEVILRHLASRSDDPQIAESLDAILELKESGL